MRIAHRRPVLAAVTALALAVPLAATLTPAAAAELPSVRINEVEQNGDAVGDWVEIVNIGQTPADVSGWVLKDDKDDRTLAIADGTVLAPGAYLTVIVDDKANPANFGLGRADTARLYLGDATTLVDAFAWTDHAATSYGRCADGTGEFVQTVAPTFNAANSCDVSIVDSVRINEVDSKDADPVDWIELTNTARAAVDVSGLVLRDNKDASLVTVPAGSIIPAGGFLAVDVDTATGFGLGEADSARLFLADGSTLVDTYSWSGHAATSYGRYPDGSGEFVLTATATKNAPNQRVAPALPAVRVNEVESSGGTPGDWIELLNTGTTAVDVSGWKISDSDPEHISTIPAGTSIAAGGYYIVEEAALGFGLGAADSAIVHLADGFTVVDQRSWTTHAPTTTYGVCGTSFVETTSSTKGAANDCGAPVRINEIESQDGVPGDWIELKNNGSAPLDISGYVLKDNSEKTPFLVAAGTTIAAGGYFVADLDGYYGLGGADSVRLFAPDGTTLIDSHTWTAHATATTYGRCADGTGAFATTASSTKGAVNDCVGDLVTETWPGSPEVATRDVKGTFASNMSGLAYEAAESGDVLWAARNGVGALFRLVSDGTNWVPDAADGWGSGKLLHYEDGTGDVDAEGVAFTAAGSSAGVFIASERNNSVSGTSRLSVLRYDASAAGSSLSANMEWNLNADLPVVGANAGLEGIAWVPDSYLVGAGLVDESTKAVYDPAAHPGHGDGLFFVALEAGGGVYGYALNQTTGGYTRVVTIDSGFPSVMELEFDVENQQLWAVCDDGCDGRSAVLDISAEGAFEVATVYERPAGMANLNNEGFTLAPQAQCVDGAKPVFWSDDSSTDGFAIRSGAIDCVVVTEPGTPGGPGTPGEPGTPTEPGAPTLPGAPAPTPQPAQTGATTPVAGEALTEASRGSVSAPTSAQRGATITISVGTQYAGDTVHLWLHSTPVYLGAQTVSAAGTVRVAIPADAPLGAHRIAVLAADGSLIGWDTIRVAAAGQRLASTGADLGAPIGAALLLLLVGAGLVVRRTKTAA